MPVTSRGWPCLPFVDLPVSPAAETLYGQCCPGRNSDLVHSRFPKRRTPRSQQQRRWSAGQKRTSAPSLASQICGRDRRGGGNLRNLQNRRPIAIAHVQSFFRDNHLVTRAQNGVHGVTR